MNERKKGLRKILTVFKKERKKSNEEHWQKEGKKERKKERKKEKNVKHYLY